MPLVVHDPYFSVWSFDNSLTAGWSRHRPVTYLIWSARSTDGKPHDVQVYFDVSGEWVVNTPDQRVAWSRYRMSGLEVMRIGSFEQPILAKSGDNLRIDCSADSREGVRSDCRALRGV